MKKRFTMLLAVVIVLLSACGGGSSDGHPSSTTDSGTTGTAVAGSENTVQFDPSAVIEETILVDESDIKITATGLKYTAYDVKLSLAIENNSSQDLSFYSGTLAYSCNSVNGYMVDDGYLNADVAAGKKANETVSISVDELTLLGCSDIADIELGFRVTDDDYNEYLLTGPRQLKYVCALADRDLIHTENTSVMTRDGLKRNGNLLYTIPPIQSALDRFHKQQLAQMDLEIARQRVAKALAFRVDKEHLA